MGLSADSGAHTNGTPSSYAAKMNLHSHFLGGNSVSTAQPSRVRDFVQAHDGHTVITNVSIEPRAPTEAAARRAQTRRAQACRVRAAD